MEEPALCQGSRCLGTLVNWDDNSRVICPWCQQVLDTPNGWVPNHPKPTPAVRRAFTRKEKTQ